MKYINKTLEGMKNRQTDSEEDPSILEEIINRGMSLQDATVLMVDMLMAGIDTVYQFKWFNLIKKIKKQDLILFN